MPRWPIQASGDTAGGYSTASFDCCINRRTFGPTYGTPLYRLRTPAAEIARTLRVVMRRGSLSAAEEITGHKYETIGEWLRRAGSHAEAITEALVTELELSEVEVDAFWSFVKKSTRALQQTTPRQREWAKAPAMAIGLSDHLWTWEEFLCFPVHQYVRE